VRKLSIVFSLVTLIAALAFLAGCSSSNGSTPAGVQITVSVSASPTSLNPGQSSTITATVSNTSNQGVTWSISPANFGKLSSTTANPVTYTAPTSVPTATVVTITATSAASSSATASVQIPVATSAVTVSLLVAGLPAAPQTVNPSGTVTITANLTNDTSNKGVTWTLSGVGSLGSKTSTSVIYTTPSSVPNNESATVIATSVASSSATASLEITALPSGAGPNVAAVNVNSGPAGGSANSGFVSVTICEPGSTTGCQTVDDILVDTGSEGLRILQSVIPSLVLPSLTDNSGNILNNCVQFLDTSYLWGPVEQADIRIGGEVASSVLVQTISSSNTGVPAACSNGGTINENTPQLLGANGILGVGLEPTDCIVAGTDFCDGSVSASAPPTYFACPSSGCSSSASPVFATASQQVTNPVVLFPTDNNGVILQFPVVSGAEATVGGSLTFGIDTQSNNTLPLSANVFGLDTNDNFITLYNGQTLTASFIDSGSNALFFPSSIAVCADNTNFYCPPSLMAQQATNESAGGPPPQSVVNFSVDNADTLFSTNGGNDTAFGTLAGPQGTANTCSNGSGSCTFDWGLPFFYGRTVFTAIDGQPVSNISGPFWAY
jgi:Protein of unknown function (DUF3443)